MLYLPARCDSLQKPTTFTQYVVSNCQLQLWLQLLSPHQLHLITFTNEHYSITRPILHWRDQIRYKKCCSSLWICYQLHLITYKMNTTTSHLFQFTLERPNKVNAVQDVDLLSTLMSITASLVQLYIGETK